MLVDFADPTPMTKTEALIMLLNAERVVGDDERAPLNAVSAALLDIHSALFKVRHEAVAEKIGRIS